MVAVAGHGLDTGGALRNEREALALVTAVADLAGAWDLTRVTRTLSDFADDAVNRAVTAAHRERTPGDEPRGFAIIGLGKHGGRELNYSSDIDPIFIYDPGTLPCRAAEEPDKAAQRLARAIIALLADRNEHGYVFRVDMRLRPSPEVTPLAIPVEQAISYYESAALAWEQAAFIRARAVAGDIALGQGFLDAIQPFVWRRSLDFGQIENIAVMSRRIRDHYQAGQRVGPGYDVKRGRGGIRECEFFAQVHQLIHGGRKPALRIADTRAALAALARSNVIADDEARDLGRCYTLLRTIEHRLQMVDDRQKHSLPDQVAALDNVARLHGLPDGRALIGLLQPEVMRVGQVYDRLTAEKTSNVAAAALPADMPALTTALATMGVEEAEALAIRIAGWRSGQYRAVRSAAGIAAFEHVLPALVTALVGAPDVTRAIVGLDRLLEQLPSAINFFHLLEARPGLLKLLGDILSHAPTLAEDMARRPELLDRLIDASALELPGDVASITRRLERLAEGADYETLLDRVRGEVGEERFALGIQLVEGRQDPLEISSAYARIAEGALNVLTDAAVREFKRKHGRIKRSELVILALGRLGGGALTHASDLDLVFLFSGSSGSESDGDRPLGSSHYFNRLAQRVIAAMSVPTAAGPLYDVDTRLRPSGAQGPLAVSFDSFEKYQRESAWTWEHMALCRGRPIYGSPAALKALQKIIDGALTMNRDTAELTTAVRDMRSEMAKHKQPKGPLDVKLLPGGVVDVEFIVHYLQLLHRTAFHPPLEQAIKALADAGHLPASFGPAFLLMIRVLIAIRLVAPDCQPPSPSGQAVIAASVGEADWDALMDALDAARQLVLGQWTKLFGVRDF